MLDTLLMIKKIVQKAETGKISYEDAIRRIETLIRK